ncbi:uncharacterized protein B0I36DRAFT_329787 [Microdochium trichocladiopsis]|uniref:Uncharacterized protein n=1 Tax=Microdochium trichocladiopsis TaxID=1682393 RepID=A0A9P8Y1W6_9PEZI|nr:uncharacterized protein B0I36DRAFT_329787 [Microdochium trichocladiopsis]KAH7026054.1 hypothetical protein B0I36DRAFT_329787 [Microdochium trichocladiopsis]
MAHIMFWPNPCPISSDGTTSICVLLSIESRTALRTKYSTTRGNGDGPGPTGDEAEKSIMELCATIWTGKTYCESCTLRHLTSSDLAADSSVHSSQTVGVIVA